MRFNTLEDRMLYFRGLTNYKLMPKSYVMVMLDGRSFSTLIKDKFEKPFDNAFISMMNETAKYVCANVSGCKFGYVQSDEISLVLTDFENKGTESFFGFRLNKMLSVIASLATSKFNQLMFDYKIGQIVGCPASAGDTVQMCRDAVNGDLYQFDCKCWNVPTYEDVFAWFLYRQIDCIRNSKQQAAQARISPKQLEKLNTDEQINLLKEMTGVDWNDYEDGKKFGRFIYRVEEEFEYKGERTNPNIPATYTRHYWKATDGFRLTDEDGRERFDGIGAIPIR